MGVLQDNLVLSTGLIMRIGHRKEIRKLTFRALALRRSFDSLRRWAIRNLLENNDVMTRNDSNKPNTYEIMKLSDNSNKRLMCFGE